MRSKHFWTLAIVGFAVYFALAAYFHHSYQDPRPPGKVVMMLNPPFIHEEGNAYWVSRLIAEAQRVLTNLPADNPNDAKDTSSPIRIFESKMQLGPGHSTFREISESGRGRFAHWTGRGIYFSTSDNTDPNKNGRTYWAVVP